MLFFFEAELAARQMFRHTNLATNVSSHKPGNKCIVTQTWQQCSARKKTFSRIKEQFTKRKPFFESQRKKLWGTTKILSSEPKYILTALSTLVSDVLSFCKMINKMRHNTFNVNFTSISFKALS